MLRNGFERVDLFVSKRRKNQDGISNEPPHVNDVPVFRAIDSAYVVKTVAIKKNTGFETVNRKHIVFITIQVIRDSYFVKLEAVIQLSEIRMFFLSKKVQSLSLSVFNSFDLIENPYYRLHAIWIHALDQCEEHILEIASVYHIVEFRKHFSLNVVVIEYFF